MDQKRTLDELCALYALEPDLKDIFVEGRIDKYFLEWYLRANGGAYVSVYSIELIDIPHGVLAGYNLSVGSRRSQVLALSYQLAERCEGGLTVVCLVDRDFEDYRPGVRPNEYLLLTDCNSLELYAFTVTAIDKFLGVALGGFPMGGSQLVLVLGEILKRVFAYRLANEVLGWGMEWLDFVRYVEVKRGNVEFKADAFVRAYLQKNNKWGDRGLFGEQVNSVMSQLFDDDGRRSIRGHDFSELLLHVIRGMRKDLKYGNRETLEGALRASLECMDLRQQPCFQRVLSMATA